MLATFAAKAQEKRTNEACGYADDIFNDSLSFRKKHFVMLCSV